MNPLIKQHIGEVHNNREVVGRAADRNYYRRGHNGAGPRQIIRYWIVECLACGDVRETSWQNVKKSGCFACTSTGPLDSDDHVLVSLLRAAWTSNAKTRGLSFSLSNDEILRIAKSPCHYCGTVGSNTKIRPTGKKPLSYNGADRMDNSVGYESNNAVSCCRTCNRAKGTLTVEDFLNWATTLAKATRKRLESDGQS